jgi:hypothetical protein
MSPSDFLKYNENTSLTSQIQTVHFNTSKLLSLYLVLSAEVTIYLNGNSVTLYDFLEFWDGAVAKWQLPINERQYMVTRSLLTFSWVPLSTVNPHSGLTAGWCNIHPSFSYLLLKDVTDVNYDRVGEKSMCMAYINGRQWFSHWYLNRVVLNMNKEVGIVGQKRFIKFTLNHWSTHCGPDTVEVLYSTIMTQAQLFNRQFIIE